MNRKAMRKILAVITLAVLLASAALADTLYLKNGSVLKGTFIGYENGQFIFELPNGNRPRFRPTEVDRLVIDRDTVGDNRPDPSRPDPPSRDPRPGSGGTGSTNAGWNSFPAFNVQLEEKWVRSTVQVTRGQRIRVEATGTVTLEGRTQTGPDGLSGRRDPDAPMPDANDGALIAAIGQDQNSPPIFIGRGVEFIAENDGLLYFTVNHWEVTNARGAFRVTVSIDRNYRGDVGGSTGGQPTQGKEKTVLVYANQQWTDTGIDVEPNMTFEITAEGEVEIGNRNYARPEGNQNAKVRGSNYPMPDAGVGALIGKIRYRDGRDSNLVLVGSQGSPSSEAGEYGRLFLGINDDYIKDNKGSFKVVIRW